MTRIDRFTEQETDHWPDDMQSGVLYVDLPRGVVYFLCPCGCGDNVRLCVGDQNKPAPTENSPHTWAFSRGEHGPTLAPSVQAAKSGCGAHFTLTDGQVAWH